MYRFEFYTVYLIGVRGSMANYNLFMNYLARFEISKQF